MCVPTTTAVIIFRSADPEFFSAHAKVYPSPDDVVDRLRVVMSRGGQTPDGEVRLERLLEAAPWAHRS